MNGAVVVAFVGGFVANAILGLVIEWLASRKAKRRKVNQGDYYAICEGCTADSQMGRVSSVLRFAKIRERQ